MIQSSSFLLPLCLTYLLICSGCTINLPSSSQSPSSSSSYQHQDQSSDANKDKPIIQETTESITPELKAKAIKALTLIDQREITIDHLFVMSYQVCEKIAGRTDKETVINCTMYSLQKLREIGLYDDNQLKESLKEFNIDGYLDQVFEVLYAKERESQLSNTY